MMTMGFKGLINCSSITLRAILLLIMSLPF